MALFKGENRHESISMVIGSILLIVGLIVLFIGFAFAFSIASNPGGYLKSQMPDVTEQTTKGPRAEFRYDVNNLTVTFHDSSQSGDASINYWHWEFGDGATVDGQNPPAHMYVGDFKPTVQLLVRDSNNKESRALASFHAGGGELTGGNSMPDYSDVASAFNFGDLLGPLMALPSGFVAVFLAFLMLFVIWLVGASIVKAGWNLIRPRPETIRVRIKPKDIQVEPVYPTTYAAPPQVPPQEQMQAPPPYIPPQGPQMQPPPPPMQQ